MLNKKHNKKYLLTGIVFLVFCFGFSLFSNQKALAVTPPAIDTATWSNVVWNSGDANVSGWTETADQLSNISMTSTATGGDIRWDYAGSNNDGEDYWPIGYPFDSEDSPDKTEAVGNAWIFVYRSDNKWHPATFDYLRPHQKAKDIGNILCGGSQGTLRGLSGFVPRVGDTYGFMITGLARNSTRNIEKRSNVVMAPYTGPTNLGLCHEETPTYTLTINKTGTGSGTVSGGGSYNEGSRVTAIATASTGSRFISWSGDCSGTNTNFRVTMNANKTCTATFTLNRPTLTLNMSGVGSGTVTGAGTYDFGTTVHVSAAASNGSAFAGWSGMFCNSTDPNIDVLMNGDKTCTATFNTGGSGGGNGGETGIGTPILDVMTGWKNGVAYNPDKNQYLVVGSTTHVDKISGQLVDNDGKKIGNTFVINNSNEIPGNPTAVYFPSVKKYLIVYAQSQGSPDSPTGAGHVYGRFVSDTGTVLGAPINMTPTQRGGWVRSFNLAYDAVNKKYVVVYEIFDDRGNNLDVVRLNTISDAGVLGTEITVVPVGAKQYGADVTVNPTSGEYCVVWGQETPAVNNLARVLMKSVNIGSGALGTTKILSGDGDGYTAFVGNIRIELNPDTNKYLAIWQNLSQSGGIGGYRLMGRMLNDCGGSFDSNILEIKDKAWAQDLVYNPYSKVFAVAEEKTVSANNGSGNGEINEIVFINSVGRVIDSGVVFSDFGPTGNKNPSIAVNTTDGTFGMASSRDFGLIRFRAKLIYNPNVGPPAGGCNPMPEDPVLLEACIWWLTVQPPAGPVFPPGSDPENPTHVGTSGVWGIDLAYNKKNNTILVASWGTKANGKSAIYTTILNADSLQAIGSTNRIDQDTTNLFKGTPRVVYNPDLDKFFVAWEDERPASNRRSIFGRFLLGDGTPDGNEFPIMTTANTFLRNVLYNSKDKKYAVIGENDNNTLFIVGNNGIVLNTVNLRIESDRKFYEGQPEFTYNPDLNEYWVTYVWCTNVGTAARPIDQCNDKLIRIKGDTLQKVGLPIFLANGKFVGAARIDYSINDKGAMIVWDGQDMGIYGQTLSNDLTLSVPFPILTPETLTYADGYNMPDLEYNKDSKTFFISSQDYVGGNITVEFDYSGFIYETKQPIAPPVAFNTNLKNWFAKLFGIKTAMATAYGNYNPRITTGNGKVFVGASQNYANTVVSSAYSVAAASSPATSPEPDTPADSTPVDTSSLSKLINQIYVYALGAAALLALLMMILGGYYRLTSAGNAQQATKGTDIIMSSLIGLVLLFGSYLLLNTINPAFTNLDMTSINQLNTPPSP